MIVFWGFFLPFGCGIMSLSLQEGDMRVFLIILIIIFVGAGAFFLFGQPKTIELVSNVKGGDFLLAVPEATEPDVEGGEIVAKGGSTIQENGGDIQKQLPLSNPPNEVKAIYATGWSAGSSREVDYFLDLIRTTELNAIVIDVKDYSGHLSYRMDIPIANEVGAFNEIRVVRPNELIKKLHNEGVYVIARISVFQDSILANGRPEWAIRSSSTEGVWLDRKGLAWMDPAAKPVWDYNIEIARDAFQRGFDEVNFDYIRFPSDGDLDDTRFPFWDEQRPMAQIIESFFAYARESLSGRKLSADLFGLTTIESSDLGIGQIIEAAFPYFDYITPMVYPSHYGAGSFGYATPALYPYEVVKNSMARAMERLEVYSKGPIMKSSSSASSSFEAKVSSSVAGYGLPVKFRPWLQDFDLGADYSADMVRAQINAAEESGSEGWMLWNPSNVYTKEALKGEGI